MTVPGVPVIARSGEDLTTAELYEIWRIRDIVFAVEQQCDEPDVDDVDLRPDCVHLWIADDRGRISSYLRTYLADDGVRKFGRVATVREQRGRGLSRALVQTVIDHYGDDELRISAQSYLERWYASFGFRTEGPHFTEAGIDHVGMRRSGAATDRA